MYFPWGAINIFYSSKSLIKNWLLKFWLINILYMPKWIKLIYKIHNVM